MTSGAYGHTLGAACGLGYLRGDVPAGSGFVVDCAGRRVPATVSDDAVLRPGERAPARLSATASQGRRTVRDDVGVRAVLLDIDGVLYVEDDAIPGATDAVRRLRADGLALRFVTNTTNRSRAATLARLRGLGFAVEDAELLTPAALAVQLCEQRGHRRVALFAASELRDDFTALGRRRTARTVDAVILGDLGEAWDYAALNRAFRLVVGGADLIALQKNRYWRRADGLALDAGPFVAALEYATEATATVVGKPARAFFEQALAGPGAGRDEAVMVGDDIESDVGGALAAGLAAVLVRTGKYREDRITASGIAPTATADSIADVPELLAGLRS